MRGILWTTALASLIASASAWADGNTPAEPAGGAVVTALATIVVPVLPAFDRVSLLERKPTANDPFNRLKGAFRHRFASAMMDLYPVAGTGFHMSVGSRFFKKQSIQRDQQEATRGLLYVPRLPRGSNSGVRGFRRATPAATLGYTELLRPNLAVGMEAGTLLGRVVQPLSGRRIAGLPGLGRREQTMRTNPLVNLTLAYAF